ncbi:MAG: hypothetical protein R3F59_17955 [Myxococcota bacterium]
MEPTNPLHEVAEAHDHDGFRVRLPRPLRRSVVRCTVALTVATVPVALLGGYAVEAWRTRLRA